MSTTSNKTFCISMYPEYKLVIQCVLHFFLQAKERGRIKFQSEIDSIISDLFNINAAYAGKLRKLYFPSGGNQHSVESSDERLNCCKISHFNFKRMASICETYGIRIPDEARDEILLLSASALPVSEILNDKSELEIHQGFKTAAKSWMDEIDIIMKDNADLKASIFMYLHQFRDNELIWWLLATLCSIEEEKVRKWIDVFDNIPSEKSIRESAEAAEKTNFLMDFYKKFYRLNASNLKLIYNGISGFDLICAYRHRDYFKQFARTPLRQNDVYLSYLIVATLKQHPQELMLEQIASASKANLPIDFCPKDERLIDWGIQTAW